MPHRDPEAARKWRATYNLLHAEERRRYFHEYDRTQRPDRPRLSGRPKRGTDERFWSYVLKGDGCWEWQGSRLRKGYGEVQLRGRRTKAHRLAWELCNGPIPEGMVVLHRCDNPPCCNPAHLDLGTPADNVRDRDAKGRGNAGRGDRHGSRTHPERYRLRAKLSPEIAADIRRRYAAGGISQAKLAAEYGVAESAIYAVIKGSIYRT